MLQHLHSTTHWVFPVFVYLYLNPQLLKKKTNDKVFKLESKRLCQDGQTSSFPKNQRRKKILCHVGALCDAFGICSISKVKPRGSYVSSSIWSFRFNCSFKNNWTLPINKISFAQSKGRWVSKGIRFRINSNLLKLYALN